MIYLFIQIKKWCVCWPMFHLFLSMLVCLLVTNSRHRLWLRAASPELQEEEQAASKPPRPARQTLKLSKKRRPARLDVASSMQQSLHGLQSETQLSVCAHFTNLIAITQNSASLTYNRQTKGHIHGAALGQKAKHGVLHDAVLYSTAQLSFLMCCFWPLQTSQPLSCQRLRS